MNNKKNSPTSVRTCMLRVQIESGKRNHSIHILHGFKDDIPEYLPQGDRKVLECFFNLVWIGL